MKNQADLIKSVDEANEILKDLYKRAKPAYLKNDPEKKKIYDAAFQECMELCHSYFAIARKAVKNEITNFKNLEQHFKTIQEKYYALKKL